MIDHVIQLRRPDGRWSTIGTEDAQGITAENLSMNADEHGPLTASFTLRRLHDIPWSDLLAATQVKITADGNTVWGGRINQTPGSGKGTQAQIAVSAQGWQSHLDDDQLDRGWVHNNLAAWQSSADFPGWMNLGATAAVNAQKGVNSGAQPILMWSIGDTQTLNTSVSTTIDLGPNRTWIRAVVQVASKDTTNLVLYVIGTNEDWWNGASRIDAITGQALTTGATQTFAGSLTAARRYCHVMLFSTPATTVNIAQDRGSALLDAKLFADTTYESGNVSTLVASQVATTTLLSGILPLLSKDTSGITPTVFALPTFWPQGYQTPRQIIGAVNAFHDYLWGVDANATLFFKARTTTPDYEMGEWSGDDFADASLGNLDGLYNRCIVQYADLAGRPGVAIVTGSSPILTLQGLTRTMTVAPGAALTAAGATQIGGAYLARKITAPLQGGISVGPKDVRTMFGQNIHPAQLLNATGKRIRLMNRVDPQTGAFGRVGTIVNVAYDAATEKATLQLDNSTTSLDALLARLALIQGRA